MSDPTKKVMTLANKITISRMLLIPIIVIGLLEGHTTWVYILLAISMLTDLFDGLVARRRGERTQLGAFLDPMADKLLLTAMYLTLTYLGRIDMWVFVVVFSRDLMIVLGFAVIYILTGSTAVTPRPLGKTATAAQMCTALAVLLPFPPVVSVIMMWTTITLTIASLVDYLRVGERRLGEWN
jgi:cardiolipin synthase (CMP-forming)